MSDRHDRAMRRLLELLEARGAIGAADAQEIDAMLSPRPRVDGTRDPLPRMETK